MVPPAASSESNMDVVDEQLDAAALNGMDPGVSELPENTSNAPIIEEEKECDSVAAASVSTAAVKENDTAIEQQPLASYPRLPSIAVDTEPIPVSDYRIYLPCSDDVV